MKVEIDFNAGEGWEDITASVKRDGFSKVQKLHSDFKPVVNSCKLELLGDPELFTKIINSESATVRITDDLGSPYFTGSVKNDFSGKMSTRLKGSSVEVVDFSYHLKRKVGQAVCWKSYKICDNANIGSSIIHSFLAILGLAPGDISAANIDKTIPYFTCDYDETFESVLTSLVSEFGYVYHFDDAGKFTVHKMIPDEILTENFFDNSNMIGELSIKKKEEEKERVSVKWWSLEVKNGAIVFSDTTGGSSAYKCDIPLNAGQFYPDGSGEGVVYSEFKYGDYEVVAVESPYHSIIADAPIEVQTWTPFLRKADLSVKNTSALIQRIHKFDILGNVIYKKNLNISEVSNISGSDKQDEIEARFIYSKDDAQYLATIRALYYKYSDFTYTLKSKAVFSVGSLVRVVESVDLNIDNTCIVSEIKEDSYGMRFYTLEGISAYQVILAQTETVNVQPAPAVPGHGVSPEDVPGGIPSFQDLEEGWNSDVKTTIPTDVLLSAQGAFKSVVLRWGRQPELSNFLEYHLQVSSDGIAWFPLCFDGSDFKTGLEGAYSTFPSELLVHTPIPFGGTADAPEGVTLAYRCRRVTVTGLMSDWTATNSQAAATTTTIQTQDIPANSITANKLEAAILHSMFALVDTEIVIGKNYADIPSLGSRRLVIHEHRLMMQVYSESTWVNDVVLGGFDSLGEFLPYLTARGIMSPSATLPAVGGATPNNYCTHWPLDADLLSNESFDETELSSGSFVVGAYNNGFQGSLFLKRSLYGKNADFSMHFNKIVNGVLLRQYISYGALVAGATKTATATGGTSSFTYFGHTTPVKINDYTYTVGFCARQNGTPDWDMTFSCTINLVDDVESLSSDLVLTLPRKKLSSIVFNSYGLGIGSYNTNPFYINTNESSFGAEGSTKLTFSFSNSGTTIYLKVTESLPIHVFVPSFEISRTEASTLSSKKYNADGSTTNGTLVAADSGLILLSGRSTYADLQVISGSEVTPVTYSLFSQEFGAGVPAFPSGLSGTWTTFNNVGILFLCADQVGEYLDDLLYSAMNEDVAVYEDHYKEGVPWNPVFRNGDIVLAPASGGRVIIYGELVNDTVTVVGPAGAKGDTPSHEWSGTELRLENPDGSMGDYVDLKGEKGEIGFTALPYDPNRSYLVDEQCILNSTLYICISPSQGNSPDEVGSVYWGLFYYQQLLDAVWPIGITYTQFPGDLTPAELGLPGTWSNVSSELAGDFIRFEGGDALAFNGGRQGFAMQRMIGQFGTGSNDNSIWRTQTYGHTGVFRYLYGSAQFDRGTNGQTAKTSGVTFDSSRAAETSTETRGVNRTVRKWRRES